MEASNGKRSGNGIGRAPTTMKDDEDDDNDRNNETTPFESSQNKRLKITPDEIRSTSSPRLEAPQQRDNDDGGCDLASLLIDRSGQSTTAPYATPTAAATTTSNEYSYASNIKIKKEEEESEDDTL